MENLEKSHSEVSELIRELEVNRESVRARHLAAVKVWQKTPEAKTMISEKLHGLLDGFSDEYIAIERESYRRGIARWRKTMPYIDFSQQSEEESFARYLDFMGGETAVYQACVLELIRVNPRFSRAVNRLEEETRDFFMSLPEGLALAAELESLREWGAVISEECERIVAEAERRAEASVAPTPEEVAAQAEKAAQIAAQRAAENRVRKAQRKAEAEARKAEAEARKAEAHAEWLRVHGKG